MKTLAGNPICSVHRIKMHETFDVSFEKGFGDIRLACRACELEAYFPWHEKEAKRLEVSNPSLSAKHLIGIEESKQKIKEMMNGKRNHFGDLKK